MRSFIEEQLGVPVRYVVNTHYHADHTWGNCFFPGATIVSHATCRELMEVRGPTSLEAARRQNSSFRQVKLVYPHLTFDDGYFDAAYREEKPGLYPHTRSQLGRNLHFGGRRPGVICR